MKISSRTTIDRVTQKTTTTTYFFLLLFLQHFFIHFQNFEKSVSSLAQRIKIISIFWKWSDWLGSLRYLCWYSQHNIFQFDNNHMHHHHHHLKRINPIDLRVLTIDWSSFWSYGERVSRLANTHTRTHNTGCTSIRFCVFCTFCKVSRLYHAQEERITLQQQQQQRQISNASLVSRACHDTHGDLT